MRGKIKNYKSLLYFNMSTPTEINNPELELKKPPKKANQLKGISWGVVHGITAIIYLSIPLKLIWTYWIPLNNLEFLGNEIYTVALLVLFLYIITIIISAIYFAAMFRAFFQRKNSDLGIPKGVQWVSIITLVSVIGFMIYWFIMTGGQIAFFSMTYP